MQACKSRCLGVCLQKNISEGSWENGPCVPSLGARETLRMNQMIGRDGEKEEGKQRESLMSEGCNGSHQGRGMSPRCGLPQQQESDSQPPPIRMCDLVLLDKLGGHGRHH